MNRSLLTAFVLPSIIFYQSNASILYSSENLIDQVKREQARFVFDLSETYNTIVVSNDQIEEVCPPESNKIVEEEQPTYESNKKASRSERNSTSRPEARLSKANKQSVNKKSTASLNAIEQKFSDLAYSKLPDNKKGETELARMLANMSGTILYGTKMIETNKQEYIIF